MTETQKILVTSGLTLVGGVFLFFANNIATELVLRPVSELRKVVSDVAYALVFHGNYIASSSRADDPERHDLISRELRGLSARIRAAVAAICFYELLAILGILPAKADVLKASSLLIRLSNLTGSDRDWEIKYDDKKQIERLLGLADAEPKPSPSHAVL